MGEKLDRMERVMAAELKSILKRRDIMKVPSRAT